MSSEYFDCRTASGRSQAPVISVDLRIVQIHIFYHGLLQDGGYDTCIVIVTDENIWAACGTDGIQNGTCISTMYIMVPVRMLIRELRFRHCAATTLTEAVSSGNPKGADMMFTSFRQ